MHIHVFLSGGPEQDAFWEHRAAAGLFTSFLSNRNLLLSCQTLKVQSKKEENEELKTQIYDVKTHSSEPSDTLQFSSCFRRSHLRILNVFTAERSELFRVHLTTTLSSFTD